jgi:hypothetical protein
VNEIAFGLLGGIVVAGVPAGIAALATRKKVKAETADLITESAERIILRLEAIIVRLEQESGNHIVEIQDLKVEVNRLRALVRSLGHDPDIDITKQGDTP